MTRRLAGYRGMTAGIAACFVALGIGGPALMLAAPPARAAFREVDIVDDEFTPSEIIVRRGDTVVWIHRGVRPHGVRASDGSFDSSPGCSFQNGEACMRNGERYSRTFDTAGTFNYYCPVHGSANGVGMAGQITVASGEGSGGGTTTTTRRPPSTTQTTRSGTTMQPPPTGGTTTQSPGTPPTSPPPGAPPPAAPPATGPDGQVAPPSPTIIAQVEGSTTTVVAAPVAVDADDDGLNVFILVALATVLAAALSGAAWYYRPGARQPTDPPVPPPGP